MAKSKQTRNSRAQHSQTRTDLAARLPDVLKFLCLVGLGGWVVLPELPVHYFLARDPVDPTRLFPIIRSHAHVNNPVSLHLLWMVEGVRTIPLLWRLTLAAIPVALCVGALPIPQRWSQHVAATSMRIWQWLIPFGAGLAAAVWYTVLRVDYAVNTTFGDGLPLPGELDAGRRHPAEALTMDFFLWLKGFARSIDSNIAASDVIATAAILCGGLFVAAVAVFAIRVGRSVIERAILFAGLTTTASSTMFYGYVETTALETAAIACFLAAGAVLLTTEKSSERWAWTAVAFVFAGLSFCAHAGGITMAPPLLVLMIIAARGPTGRWAANGIRLAMFTLLTVLPYYLRVLRPFYLRNSFGNVRGGGDGIAFVPWSVDYTDLPSRFVFYSMVSVWHFCEIASATLVSAPWALPVILLCGAAYYVRRFSIERGDIHILLFLGTATASAASIPLLWNHDFSTWGDWNLSATYLFPLNVLGWTLLVVVLRALGIEGRRFVAVTLPLLVVQIYLTLGIQLQLY